MIGSRLVFWPVEFPEGSRVVFVTASLFAWFTALSKDCQSIDQDNTIQEGSHRVLVSDFGDDVTRRSHNFFYLLIRFKDC
jgi:hypothetical protein